MILKIYRMTEFVENGFHPALVIVEIAKNSYIAVPVNILCKGMRILARLVVQVTP